MADAIVSAVAEQLISTVKEQIQNEIQLVRGVDKELLDLSDKLNTIRNVLVDADKRQFKETSVKDWLRRLEQTSYKMEDVLEEWNYTILQHKMEFESAAPPKHKVCSFIPSSCLCIKKVVVRRDIAKKIKNLKSRLDEILEEKDRYNFVISQPKNDTSPASWRVQSTSLIDSEEVRGRNDDRNILVSKLTANCGSREGLGYHILSIVGAGGVGKTTLAQLVYNDSRVKQCFDLRIWLCISDPFDVAAIAKGIIERIPNRSSPDTNQLDALLEVLIDSISGKQFLLVLDDVWNEEVAKWEPLEKALKCGGASSKILVTSRKVKVAKIMGTVDEDIHHPKLLSDEDCWLLLSRSALFGRSEREFEYFQKIGRDIAKKCNGLPLAAKTLGSLLRFKNIIQEWENVLKSEMWGLEPVEVELFPHLLLSYLELSPKLKRCFLYCAFFSKDENIQVEQLIRIWMALGYLGSNIGSAGDDMELKGREYFQDLAMRSLFQDFEEDYSTEQITSCKMHDIVHDFTQFLRKNNERVDAPGTTKRSCLVCNPFLVSQAQEYRILFWSEASPPNLCDCLTNVRVLGFKRELNGSPQGIEKLIHLRWLDLSGTKLSKEDLKTICKLYFLQTLLLADCDLKEIPGKIGNLVHLRHLHLSGNTTLKKLPESMCSLLELQTLDIQGCWNLCELPKGIHRLENLKHLICGNTPGLRRCFPQGVAQLSGLRTLTEFQGGSGSNKLGLLKNLNRLTGSLYLFIKLSSRSDVVELVEEGREAELRNKIHIQTLDLDFYDEMDENECSTSLWMDVIEALEPSQNLKGLQIWGYKGSRLPHWISSPLNLVRKICLLDFSHLSLLPPMEKLPFLEELYMRGLKELKLVGGEWLGLGGRGTGTGTGVEEMHIQSSSTNAVVVFPKLKRLTFRECSKWSEWEDITSQEEESAILSIMPCLTDLNIELCEGLKMLPHRLLRKASSLQVLRIISSELIECYGDKDGSTWRSISQCNPQLRLELS